MKLSKEQVAALAGLDWGALLRILKNLPQIMALVKQFAPFLPLITELLDMLRSDKDEEGPSVVVSSSGQPTFAEVESALVNAIAAAKSLKGA